MHRIEEVRSETSGENAVEDVIVGQDRAQKLLLGLDVVRHMILRLRTRKADLVTSFMAAPPAVIFCAVVDPTILGRRDPDSQYMVLKAFTQGGGTRSRCRGDTIQCGSWATAASVHRHRVRRKFAGITGAGMRRTPLAAGRARIASDLFVVRTVEEASDKPARVARRESVGTQGDVLPAPRRPRAAVRATMPVSSTSRLASAKSSTAIMASPSTRSPCLRLLRPCHRSTSHRRSMKGPSGKGFRRTPPRSRPGRRRRPPSRTSRVPATGRDDHVVAGEQAVDEGARVQRLGCRDGGKGVRPVQRFAAPPGPGIDELAPMDPQASPRGPAPPRPRSPRRTGGRRAPTRLSPAKRSGRSRQRSTSRSTCRTGRSLRRRRSCLPPGLSRPRSPPPRSSMSVPPRIRDLPSKRLHVFDPKGVPTELKG